MSVVETTEARRGPQVASPRAIVAIPASNEAERIGACLDALAAQPVPPGTFGVLLFLNNCSDATREIAERHGAAFPWPLKIEERNDVDAGAGWARREAMNAAADWLAAAGDARSGILLTSDADSRVGADWVARNLAAIDAGADLVGGVIEFDPDEPPPASVQVRGALEARYEALLVEIAARLDPQPGNPWPTHGATSGASLAVRLDVYRRVGGMPALASGEDSAFAQRVRDADFVVRHDPSVTVVTSGRARGRAVGGTADAIAERIATANAPCDPRLERLDRAVLRIVWRRRLRAAVAADRPRADAKHLRSWATRLAVPADVTAEAVASPFCGRAVALVEAASPRLARKPLRPTSLPLQIALAGALLAALRLKDGLRAARPADSRGSAAAATR